MSEQVKDSATLNPRWIAPIYKLSGGQDFLGLRAVQTNIASYLLPGIITITPSARYYPLYCWLIKEYGEGHPQGMTLATFIKRREQIFILANLAWSERSEDDFDNMGLQGSTNLLQHWEAHRGTGFVPLNKGNYLRAKYGGFNAYTGVMSALLLLRREESNVIKLLPKGQALAAAFSQAIEGTRYHTKRPVYDERASIPCEVLEEYGARCHLSLMKQFPDGPATLEVLFAFDAKQLLPSPQATSYRGNMQGSLGLILDMINQSGQISEWKFRQFIAYGLCKDYPPYQPAAPLRPFLAHWQMFQLREYYVYALYALWSYFLYWLKVNGPETLAGFDEHLRESVDMTTVARELDVDLPSKLASQWGLKEWLEALLDLSDVPAGEFHNRCSFFAQKSQIPASEHRLYRALRQPGRNQTALYAGLAWWLLSTLYLRLLGMAESERWGASHWANEGGAKRRSLKLFVDDISNHIANNSHLDTVWAWMYRDYIVSQHTLIALEKWHQRELNTFHFTYDGGLFTWLIDDKASFSGVRFRQAYDMLADLGLYEINVIENKAHLTDRGKEMLARVLEACSDFEAQK